MKILITGSKGFIGSNLISHAKNIFGINILEFTKNNSIEDLNESINAADVVIHLAGTNRPNNSLDFKTNNQELTELICKAIALKGKATPIIFTSSTQATQDNPYGRSKLEAENLIKKLNHETDNPALIYRLPGVFGKWCKPNYNNVVATFCYNIANDLPIKIDDPYKSIPLVYIDDVIKNILKTIEKPFLGLNYTTVTPEYPTNIGLLAKQLFQFKESQASIDLPKISNSFTYSLYATYLSYLPITSSIYNLQASTDARGSFTEILRNESFGQVSCITANIGITRGGHFHHSKVEKFLIVKGSARFRFHNVLTNERFEISTTEERPQIVQTLPGWSHDITNIGNCQMIAFIWSSEIFDPLYPDTIKSDI